MSIRIANLLNTAQGDKLNEREISDNQTDTQHENQTKQIRDIEGTVKRSNISAIQEREQIHNQKKEFEEIIARIFPKLEKTLSHMLMEYYKPQVRQKNTWVFHSKITKEKNLNISKGSK